MKESQDVSSPSGGGEESIPRAKCGPEHLRNVLLLLGSYTSFHLAPFKLTSVPNCAEQDGVERFEIFQGPFRDIYAVLKVFLRVPVKSAKLKRTMLASTEFFQNSNSSLHHFDPNTVAGYYRDTVTLCARLHGLRCIDRISSMDLKVAVKLPGVVRMTL